MSRRRLCWRFCLLGSVLAAAKPASAQDYAEFLKPGAPVRVWLQSQGYEKKAGVVALRRGESLDVRMRFRLGMGTGVQMEVVHLSLQQIDSIEVGIVSKGNFGHSVLKGCMVSGAWFGLGAGGISAMMRAGNAPALALIFGAAGCVPGALVGGIFSTPDHTTWAMVPKTQSRTLAVASAASAASAARSVAVTATPSVTTGRGHRVLPNDERLLPGHRVRLWGDALSASPTIGIVATNTGDSLVVTVASAGPQHIAVSQLDSLQVEVRTLRKSPAKRAAFLGLVGGAIIGAAMSPSSQSSQCRQGFAPCGKGAGAIGGGVLGFFGGGILGMLFGGGENVRWVAVPLSP